MLSSIFGRGLVLDLLQVFGDTFSQSRFETSRLFYSINSNTTEDNV